MSYARPDNVSDALEALSGADRRILAGGTDFFPALGDLPVDGRILDITNINALRGIHLREGYWQIGAATTWSDLIAADLPQAFDGLKLAAREVGSVQIQNRATIAGNICNASPAADGVPPLLTLDAEVELQSGHGTRRLPLGTFITGNRQTSRRNNELLTAILVPEGSATGGSSFEKLGSRRYLVISIAMVACRLSLDEHGRIGALALSVGACSPVARRLSRFEARLIGEPLERIGDLDLTETDLEPLTPIDDVRAPAVYRLSAVQRLVHQALIQAAREA